MNAKKVLVAFALALGALAHPAWSAVSLTSPANNALYLAPATAIPVKANATASGGLTVVRVDFYANGNLIYTDTTSPYQFDWTNVAAGTYTLTAKMVDSAGGETTSAPRTITVAANNTPPTVALSAPANNANYISPASVTASATASGPELNDLLQRVEFYLNGNLATTVIQAPYTTSLTGLADGSYTLTAVAVDGQGAQTTSAARTFAIGANQPPTVSITTPLDNSKWHAPAGFPFQVSAAAPEVNDTLTVEFYANGSLLGTRTSAPWSFNVTNLAAGTYALTAKAIDGQGAQTTSAARTIVVSDTNNPPTVSLTAPAANANFPAPAPSITVSATANAGEVNGWITRVEFYVNGVLTNTDTAGPFSFSWTNVPAGSYTLTAKAVDQLNGETVSAPINITVGAAALYFIHTDHLNTPRVITNQAAQVVWRWDHAEPFGSNPPNENPSGLGTFTCNLRLPGQYFDKETNLHFNMARDYDPAIGRYVESDPIGLYGGINTYTYVGGTPLNYADPSGQVVPLIVAGAVLGSVISSGIYAATTSQFTWQGLAGAALAGALTGAVGTFATPIAGAVGLGTGLVGTGAVNAAAGLLGGIVIGALDPCQNLTPSFVTSSALFGAFGGFAGGRLFPTIGMKAFGQVGFPRTWSGVIPAALGGSGGTNLNPIYTGGMVSGFVGAAGPTGVANYVQ